MSRLKQICIAALFSLLPLTAQESYHYIVYFWKIPCVDVTMSLFEDHKNGQSELLFTTKTRELFSYFFSVNNSYTTVFDKETFQLLHYEKKVKQPNIQQKITIMWNSDDNTYQYEKTSYERPRNTHNVFSLLMRVRFAPPETLDTKWWYVDHEGQILKSRFLWIDSSEVTMGGKKYPADHYRLDLIPEENENVQLTEMTDVFTWGIALDGSVRQIWVERGGKRRILKASVSARGVTMVGELQ